MNDHGLPTLSDAARALVEQSAAIPSAPAGAKGRVLERLEGMMGPPGGGGGAPRGEGPSAAAAHSLPVAASWVRLAPLAASFVVGAMVGGAAMRAWSPAPPAPVAVQALPPLPVPASIAAPAAAVASEPPIEPVVSPTPAAVRSARAVPLAVSSASPHSQLAAERLMLDAARAAVEREDGASALAAASEHERRFPAGILVQEREVLAVRALLLLGRSGEARARADRFRRRFPDSVLLPALASAVAAPPSVTSGEGADQERGEDSR